MKLNNKKAIVTGANKHIGAAIALKFASEGADILLHYHTDSQGAKAIQQQIEALGQKAFLLQADFSKQTHVTQFFEQALHLLGQVDLVVNNAAGYDTTEFLTLPAETVASLLEVGVVAPMQLLQFAAKSMLQSNRTGSLINISSISGIAPHANRTAHATAKAALNMLTKTAALDLGNHGIRVNAICPGAVPDKNNKADYVTDNIPLKRPGHPDDIANAALFLASDDASWITGHLLVVDGGQSLT